MDFAVRVVYRTVPVPGLYAFRLALPLVAAGQAAAGSSSASSVGADTQPFVWLPGAAREISRSDSASRDTAALQTSYDSRQQGSVGIELGLVRLRPVTLQHGFRVGTYFMIDLQNISTGNAYFLPAGTQFFRGLFGFSGSWSADAWAKRWFGPGSALELSLVAGHESDHATTDVPSGFSESPNPGDIVGGTGGNFFAPDLAGRFMLGHELVLTARPQWRFYLRGSGPFKDAPALDLILRWKLSRQVQPLLSTRVEYWFVDHTSNDAVNGGFARAMLGVAFPGWIGELMPFAAIDGGNGNGLLVNVRETRYTLGLRYAVF